ncbi:MAG: hypothetical protein LC808_00040 [Actinobacteria bacterium]|nr:hypothetical protein [Actinomycetota bacterium]
MGSRIAKGRSGRDGQAHGEGQGRKDLAVQVEGVGDDQAWGNINRTMLR